MWDLITGIGKFLWVIFQVIVLFNLLIVVHELGHYWAAKWRGLKVEKFQIWFGKTIWKKEINGVQWGLGTIPMGGFVALPQMAPMEMLEGGGDDKEKLPPITPLDKIIVAFAGPLFSFGLAFAFALLVWGVGKPEHVRMTTNIVGSVASDYPAAAAGLRPGDEILSVDGVEVSGFGGMVDSIIERIVFSKGETIQLVLRRPGVEELMNIEVGYKIEDKGAMERPDHRRIGIAPASPAFVAAAAEGSPAMKAGLKAGDEILSANGEILHSPVRLMQIAEQGEGKAIELLVRRAGENVFLTLIPGKPKAPEDAVYQTGIVWDNSKGQSLMHPGPDPFRQVWEGGTAIFRTIGSLFSSESDVSVRHMSSAVGIGNFYYQTLSDPVNGWRLALVLSVLINVNLGLLNLLPFPVLDGGHITMATYEWIRKKPINLRFLEIFQTACALLLIGFMVYVTFYDVGDIVRGGETEPIRW
ncbi:MAG: RIP metalloprotease RseP [Verrucomicrobiales bacterium]